MTDELLHIYTYNCKLCGAQLIPDYDYPVFYCPNLLKLVCTNNYSLTLKEVKSNTYNKEMFEVSERTL